MLAYTTDFKAAALANIRDPRARVKIYWGNALQDTGVVVSSNDENYVDRKAQVLNGVFASGATGSGWAFIGNEFLANGNFKAQPAEDSGPQVGWFGATFSDGAGDFATARYLQIDHDARPYSNIKVYGDDIYNEYPVDFDITFTYDGGTYGINVVGNSDREYSTTFSILTGVTSVKLEVTKWSAPNTIIKIIHFSGEFEEVFKGEDIVSLDILEETNTDTGAVPIGNVTSNELDLTLLNTDRRFSFGNTDSDYVDVLISGRKIEVWLGFVLPAGSTDATGDVTGYIVETEGADKVGYMPYGVYWSKDWKSSHNSMEASVSAYDMVSRLRKLDFKRSENYTGLVGFIVDDILTKAQDSIPELSWTVSSDISSINWGDVSFPITNFQQALQNIAAATISYTYVDRTGVLIVGSRLGVTTPVSPEQELTLGKYFNFESQPQDDELVNSVRVGYATYDLGAVEAIYSDTTVFEIPAGETELSLFLLWEKFPVQTSSAVLVFTPVSVAGLISMSSDIYAAGADVTITGTAGDTFQLAATGRAWAITEETEPVATDEDSVSKFGLREFSLTGNNLITSAEEAYGLATSLLSNYGDLRQDGALSMPGSTLVSVGDTVEVTEFDDGVIETKDFFLIKRQNLKFNGALDSEIELRRG